MRMVCVATVLTVLLFHAAQALKVLGPDPLMGEFPNIEALFNPVLPTYVEGRVEVAQPAHACTELTNDPESMLGAIALVQRGSCEFDAKTEMAQLAGASAVVVYDTASANPNTLPNVKIGPEKSDRGITIPTVMVHENLGRDLAAAVDATVLVTLHHTIQRTPTEDFLESTLQFGFMCLNVMIGSIVVYAAVMTTKHFLKQRQKDRFLSSIPEEILHTDAQAQLQDAQDCCAVCLNGYERGETVRRLPCRHTFHKACVDKWLREQALCPVCKLDISQTPAPAPAPATATDPPSHGTPSPAQSDNGRTSATS